MINRLANENVENGLLIIQYDTAIDFHSFRCYIYAKVLITPDNNHKAVYS